MRVSDVMTRDVVTVMPDTSVKYAGELMAEHGFAALPVVDSDNRLVGIVAEADVLRDRFPEDPRLHIRRDTDHRPDRMPLQVAGVMTAGVRFASPADDVADVARLLVMAHVRSVPVVHDGRVVGVVSRRDVLLALVRADSDIRTDVVRLVEGYTGELGCWDVWVSEGVASVRRSRGGATVSRAVEEFALDRLVRTVPGVVAVHVLRPAWTRSLPRPAP